MSVMYNNNIVKRVLTGPYAPARSFIYRWRRAASPWPLAAYEMRSGSKKLSKNKYEININNKRNRMGEAEQLCLNSWWFSRNYSDPIFDNCEYYVVSVSRRPGPGGDWFTFTRYVDMLPMPFIVVSLSSLLLQLLQIHLWRNEAKVSEAAHRHINTQRTIRGNSSCFNRGTIFKEEMSAEVMRAA